MFLGWKENFGLGTNWMQNLYFFWHFSDFDFPSLFPCIFINITKFTLSKVPNFENFNKTLKNIYQNVHCTCISEILRPFIALGMHHVKSTKTFWQFVWNTEHRCRVELGTKILSNKKWRELYQKTRTTVFQVAL